MKRIFVGSSSAARAQAKKFIAGCSIGGVTFLPWWEYFTPGRTLLEELDASRTQVDGAILIWSPESETEIRGYKRQIPNLNVLFEFGFFYGHFQQQHVAIVRYGDIYLPSDLSGYVHIFGSKFFKRGASVAVGKKTKQDFEKWITSW